MGRKGACGFYERTYCPNMVDFGAALVSLEIGSPISYPGSSLDGNSSALNARKALASWAKTEMTKNPNDPLLENLLKSPHLVKLEDSLRGRKNEHNLLGAKHLVVIKANA
jgi:hypothetical protein